VMLIMVVVIIFMVALFRLRRAGCEPSSLNPYHPLLEPQPIPLRIRAEVDTVQSRVIAWQGLSRTTGIWVGHSCSRGNGSHKGGLMNSKEATWISC
jgi:hypothetical protein